MKTLKTIFKTLVVITFLSLISCGSDDDSGDDGPGTTVRSNTFTVAADTYNTPKAYLVIKGSGSNYDSKYAFTFSEKNLRADATNGLTIDTDATEVIIIKSEDGTSNLASMQEVVDQIIIGSHTLKSGTTSIDNITSWGNTYMHNTQEFGIPTVFDIYQIDTLESNALEIESISIDVAAGTGTINCSYNYMSVTNSVIVRGEYSGTFKILNEM